jgi:putative N6-adenine-specific DNA methylase
VAERVTNVLSRGTDPGPLVVVRIMHDRVLVSVDSSGAPLFQRGWRLDSAKAPLRETLGAALLLAAGWDGGAPLVDPFCGSGTIPIEAALLAAGIAPGHQRSFAFQGWPSFQPGTWASVTGEALARPRRDVPTIVGADRDAGAVRAAAANAERAGVSLDLRHDPLSALSMPSGPPGLLISNPPYGKRVETGRDLFARLGELVRQRAEGWKVGVVVSDPVLATASGLAWREALRTTNGGIPVTLLLSG